MCHPFIDLERPLMTIVSSVTIQKRSSVIMRRRWWEGPAQELCTLEYLSTMRDINSVNLMIVFSRL